MRDNSILSKFIFINFFYDNFIATVFVSFILSWIYDTHPTRKKYIFHSLFLFFLSSETNFYHTYYSDKYAYLFILPYVKSSLLRVHGARYHKPMTYIPKQAATTIIILYTQSTSRNFNTYHYNNSC